MYNQLYIVWSNHENSTNNNFTLWHSSSHSSAVVDCYRLYDYSGMYDKTIIMGWYVGMLDHDDGGLSISLLNLYSCLCPSIIPSIIYTYNWVMILIILHDGIMLVQITGYTDDSVTNIDISSP